MISLAIANYNRAEMTIESFAQVLDNGLVDDIVIMDDYSEPDIYVKLWNAVNNLNTNNVYLIRNAENYGAFLNKYRAVKQCKNDWVIVLDCDNIIDGSYIKIASTLDKKEDVLYCPEVLYSLGKEKEQWNYSEFNKGPLDKWNIKEHIESALFGTCMNTGNFLVNRKEYIDVVELSKIDKRLCLLDSFYFNYLWVAKMNKMQVVPGLGYEHRIHDGSYYRKNKKLFATIHSELVKAVKEL